MTVTELSIKLTEYASIVKAYRDAMNDYLKNKNDLNKLNAVKLLATAAILPPPASQQNLF